MKLKPVTKLDKRNTATLKKLTMMSRQQIVTLLPFFQFMDNSGAIRKPDSGCMVYKTNIFSKSKLLSYKK